LQRTKDMRTWANGSAGIQVRRSRTFCLALAATIIAVGLPMASASASPSAASARGGSGVQVLVANSGEAAGTHVTLTSKTVVVPPSVVSSSLSGVSSDGSTYTFSNNNGPLAQVAPGKVLLLEGQDAIVVKTVKHDGPKLIVGAAPASLTDIVQSGQISVSGPPDTAAAIGVPLDTPSGEGAVPAQRGVLCP